MEKKDNLRIKGRDEIFSPTQLEALAEIARGFATLPIAHATTRGDVAIPLVKEEDLPRISAIMGRAGLKHLGDFFYQTPYIMTCSRAGICPDQSYDMRPYVQACRDYFDRYPGFRMLSKKFKMNFSNCSEDCAVTDFSDLGFIASMRQRNGASEQGFRVVLGGGLLPRPNTAEPLYEFVPAEEVLEVTQAVLEVMNDAPELRRATGTHRRAKVLTRLIGFKKVKERVEERWRALEPIDVVPYLRPEPKEPKLPPRGVYPPAPETLPQEFLDWKASNVSPQKPEGYCFVTVKLPLGNIAADQLTALAPVAGKYAAGARFIPGQNFALQYVPEDALYWVWQDLSQIGLREVGPEGITDVQACPGDVCAKHLTASLGLGGAAREVLLKLGEETLSDPLIEEVRIAISGCPRACGQHYVANIGFAGTVLSVGENQVPAYEMFLGGCQEPGKPHRLARRVGIGVPAKRVPEAIQKSLQSYIAHRRSDEDFNQFVDRVGVGPFRRLLEPLTEVPPLSPESRDFYIDWGQAELFKAEFRQEEEE